MNDAVDGCSVPDRARAEVIALMDQTVAINLDDLSVFTPAKTNQALGYGIGSSQIVRRDQKIEEFMNCLGAPFAEQVKHFGRATVRSYRQAEQWPAIVKGTAV